MNSLKNTRHMKTRDLVLCDLLLLFRNYLNPTTNEFLKNECISNMIKLKLKNKDF